MLPDPCDPTSFPLPPPLLQKHNAGLSSSSEGKKGLFEWAWQLLPVGCITTFPPPWAPVQGRLARVGWGAVVQQIKAEPIPSPCIQECLGFKNSHDSAIRQMSLIWIAFFAADAHVFASGTYWSTATSLKKKKKPITGTTGNTER